MYSLISNAVGWFFGNNENEIQSQANSPLSSYPEVDGDDDLMTLENILQLPANEKCNVQTVDGTVTHVYQGHGLIDGDIYFSFDDIRTDKDTFVKVGDRVQVTAEQIDSDGGWYARQVMVTEQCWENKKDVAEASETLQEVDLRDLQKCVVVGKVTTMTRDGGWIDDDVLFTLDDCDEEFVPAQGDWVSAFVRETVEEKTDDWNGPITHRIAFKINPLRTMEMEGIITACMTDHGYINSEVYFSKSVCANGYCPRKNEPVLVTCVETAKGKSQWRATRVVPTSRKSEANRSKRFGEKLSDSKKSSWLVPGQKPKFFKKTTILPVKIPQFAVPDALRNCVREQRELTDFAPFLAKELCYANYVRRMSSLLHLEEIQMDQDIRQYDMFRVCLRPVGEYLALTVPGLAEGRPSVLIGDRVILTIPHDPEGPSYEGYVHELTSTDVHLKFSPEFHLRYNDEDYDVVFTFSRMPLRRSHQAVSLAVQYLGSSVLFPALIDIKEPQIKMAHSIPGPASHLQGGTLSKNALDSDTGNPTRHCTANINSNNSNYNGKHSLHHRSQNVYTRYDEHSSSLPSESNDKNKRQSSDLSTLSSSNPHTHDVNYSTTSFFNPCLNTEQREAVTNILLGQARPIPYVIFGPPGTGKTITMVEAVLQIMKCVPSSRILACASSNSAADLIMERLHRSGHVSQREAVRLNAFSRSLESIPDEILKYCKFAEDLATICRYKVIVSTSSMAGSFYGLGLSPGHFTHVFVDECGQATEPECLIPIGLLSGTDGQIILAGDPKQLGPIIMSPFAKMYGLELSFLERLMNRTLYQREETSNLDGFDPLVVTMLVKNYRSHPSILSLPSKLFYYDQLEPCADSRLVNMLTGCSLLPTPTHPVMFQGLRGEDIREANSPSWFNPGEALAVVTYVQGLLNHDVDPNEIGVITPYRKQVDKIRLMIDRLGMPNVKIGSVEEFQGQERQAIIISTVRSNEKLINFDVRHTLGFLSNPKRFNVAITRAQALLIIVGNPFVLTQDENWRTFIQTCVDNGTYTGCQLPTCILQNQINQS